MLFGIWLILIKSEVLIMTAVADPDLQIRGALVIKTLT